MIYFLCFWVSQKITKYWKTVAYILLYFIIFYYLNIYAFKIDDWTNVFIYLFIFNTMKTWKIVRYYILFNFSI